MSLERRGHAGFDSFDRKVRQGGRDKTFHYTARAEAKDIPKGESRKDVAVLGSLCAHLQDGDSEGGLSRGEG
jgi:hypothetical protein